MDRLDTTDYQTSGHQATPVIPNRYEDETWRVNRPPLRISNHTQRWMVSYADFMTLLFAFFAFLYAISSVNEAKYQKMSATLMQVFDAEPTSSTPIKLDALPPGHEVEMNLQDAFDLPSLGDKNSEEEVFPQPSTLLEIRSDLENQFKQLVQDKLVFVSGNEQWLQLSVSGQLLFLPGTHQLTDESEALLYELAKRLKSLSSPIAIEGFTDDQNQKSASHWMLSATRAAAVVEYLSGAGVDPRSLSAVGYGENFPMVANDTPENRAKNRRVNIVITSQGGEKVNP